MTIRSKLNAMLRRYRELPGMIDDLPRTQWIYIAREEWKDRWRDGKQWVHPDWTPTHDEEYVRWYNESYQKPAPQPTELGFTILAHADYYWSQVYNFIESVKYVLTGRNVWTDMNTYTGREY